MYGIKAGPYVDWSAGTDRKHRLHTEQTSCPPMPLRVRLALGFALGTRLLIAVVGLAFVLQLRASLDAALDVGLASRPATLNGAPASDPSHFGPTSRAAGDERGSGGGFRLRVPISNP